MEISRGVTDAELWRLLLQGDGVAFGTIFDRHRDRLFRSALRSAGSPQDAEDVVASVFLELWRRRGNVRLVEDSLLPWLLVTTQNVVRNRTRHERRYRRFLSNLPKPAAERSAEELSVEALDGHDRHKAAAAILAMLTPADAEIITLVGLDELSIAEAATVLGVSGDAAKQRLSRARRRARKLADRLHVDGTLRAVEEG